MPDPLALTVNVPPAYVALPAEPTFPISLSSHPAGRGWEVMVNTTGLLVFILGPTETAKYPVIAPDAIVIVIDVSLHEFTVIGASLSRTTLLACELPKCKPLITTWLPIEPVVAETPVMTGAGADAELTDTLSKRAVVLFSVTAKPV